MTPAEIARIWLALDRLLIPGLVHELDEAAARVRVEYDRVGQDPVMTDWLPWFAAAAGESAAWDPPSQGEQVMVLCPSGDPRRGVALRGIYSDANPAPGDGAGEHVRIYPDGAEIAYDAVSSELRAVLPAGGTAALTAPGGVTITGDLTVTGDLAVSGDLTQDDVDVGAGHKHVTPDPGPPPVQARTGIVIP